MGTQLNIKNGEAKQLAEQLAEETGESLTLAVTTALRERLARVRKPSREAIRAKWLALGTENRRRWPDLPGSDDIDALLYDSETGLPR